MVISLPRLPGSAAPRAQRPAPSASRNAGPSTRLGREPYASNASSRAKRLALGQSGRGVQRAVDRDSAAYPRGAQRRVGIRHSCWEMPGNGGKEREYQPTRWAKRPALGHT